ncbi:MAG: methyltransferase domain-containing protein [Acidobacteria bacterium]|nr:methyltransferase domain-containing protein [Acidobacteriota bacterium]
MRTRAVVRHILAPLSLLVRRRRISRYLAQAPEPKLHVACGRNILPGWLNMDRRTVLSTRGVVYLDARKRLPFADRTFYFIFNEHFISYLTQDEALLFLKECNRVLKPSGILRIATPLWSFLVELSRNREASYQDYVNWVAAEMGCADRAAPGLVINNFLYRIGHRSVFDSETLCWMLSEAGFRNVAERPVGQSPHPRLRDIEGHGKFVPPQINALETTILEATKP